jgi:hypothetical protein
VDRMRHTLHGLPVFGLSISRAFGLARRSRLRGLLILGLLVTLGGCGAGRFGSELKERPKPEPVKQAAGFTIHLPADHPFSITLPQSSREPGLGGTAKSDAVATPQGNAEAWAEVSEGGRATAMFQLGHAFVNDTGQQADFDFVVRLNYAYSASATPQTGFPDANVGLKLYARTNLGQLARDITFFTHGTQNGPAQGAANETSQFTLTLVPHEAVDVFVAGQAVVDIRERRSATCRISVANLSMDVTICSAQADPGSGPGPAGVIEP